MGVASATIHAGICGFVTRVRAEADDEYTVRLAVESDCQKVRAYTAGLGPLNVLEELGKRHDATVLVAARDPRHGSCAGCVTPAGIYKAMQVAAGLALPAESVVELSQEGSQ